MWERVSNWLTPERERTEKPLDTVVTIATPENIEFSYEIAGPCYRLIAFVLDFLIWGGTILTVLFTASFIFAFLSGFLVQLGLGPVLQEFSGIFAGIILISIFFAYWLYWGYWESLFNGQTIAKRMMGLRVVTKNGHPITAMQGTVRTVLRAIEMLPLIPNVFFIELFSMTETFSSSGEPEVVNIIPTFFVAFLMMAFTSRFQRLGDIVCGTMVIIERRSFLFASTLPQVEDERTPLLAEFIPPNFVVSREMMLALHAYVNRRRQFSPQRRKDIARHLAEPLIAKFGLPNDTSYDLMLCALYYKAYLQTHSGEQPATIDSNSTSGVNQGEGAAS